MADKPDLVFTQTTAYAIAMHRGTTSIPIVMATSGYFPSRLVSLTVWQDRERMLPATPLMKDSGIWRQVSAVAARYEAGGYRVGVLWTYASHLYSLERKSISPMLSSGMLNDRSMSSFTL